MTAQVLKFKDEENWGPEFGVEVAAIMRDFVARKLAPLQIAIAALEAKNARLEAALAEKVPIKYLGVHRPGATYW